MKKWFLVIVELSCLLFIYLMIGAEKQAWEYVASVICLAVHVNLFHMRRTK